SSKLLIDHINETGTLQVFSQTDDILQDICAKTKVILNGNWIGVTRSPDDIYFRGWLIKPGSLKRKSYYLGYMIHRLLLCAVGSRQLDDRDHLGKKRLDTAGTLLRNLFSTVYKKMIREMTEHIKKVLANKREFNITMAIKPQTITNGLRYSMGTGNWGDQKKSMQSKSGVSQVLNRYSYSSTLSHLRRCNAPIDRDGK
ncbi:61_t:CDS:2, partial [Dentiscutata heterogama]